MERGKVGRGRFRVRPIEFQRVLDVRLGILKDAMFWCFCVKGLSVKCLTN